MNKRQLKKLLKGLTGGTRYPVGSFYFSSRMRSVIRERVNRSKTILENFKINLS